MNYKIENIPNEDSLYMRAHIAILKNQDYILTDPVPPNIFREHKGSMSADWSEHSTPEETRARKDPELNGVVGMNVGDVRDIPPLEVKHAPKPDNPAHTNIFGINQRARHKTIEIRVKLARIAEWLLRPLTR